MPTPIVDSHIHLFPAAHLPSLAWHGSNNPLGAQHSIDEYRHATSSVPTLPSSPKYLRGFIFLETDRISSIAEEDLNNPGWKHALDEVSLLARIALGEPVPGEGHQPIDAELCLGIVPWAPVPGGANVLQKYMEQVKSRTKTDEVWRKVCGVRYLVQDKPAGVMLEPKFVEALQWLGKQGLVFDLGVDARSGGLYQLRESVEMMDKVYGGVDESQQVTIVISESHPGFKFTFCTDWADHLCKPNLRLDPESVPTHAEYLEWKELITRMARASNKTYMKLSGAFSELPPLSAGTDPDIALLVDRLQPWTEVVFDAFGAERVMFGSDWPVCTIGGGGNDVSWNRWTNVVEGILERRGLTEKEKEGIWGRVAVNAYGIYI
ncbi:amidohydrolase family protein [Penicillium longicatenatum]|nr:amidohydrolase family protein [Penicillium longicatenatum]